MDRPTVRQATGPHRRWLFVLWIVLTIVGFGLIVVAAPFVFAAPGNGAWIGYIVPPLVFVLLVTGIGWLGWVTIARRPTSEDEQNDGTAGAPRM